MMASTYDDYTIAWICALPLEVAAARVMLTRTHSLLPTPSTDANAYELGELDGHYIVITCLPAGVYGTVAAANVVSRMRSTFPRLQYGLMVGIGGGVPGQNNDIRLGDVVVSKPVGQHGGVIQYDYGKTVKGGKLEPTGALNKPPQTLLTHMSQLEAKRLAGSEEDLKKIAEEVLERNPDMKDKFSPPKQHTDLLFHSSYHHIDREHTCERCDKKQLIERKSRETRTPYIHYGLIASGDQVMKDSETRDRLALQHGILCFEMEAAGLMDELPTLVIRGICDYCDSHKQKQWQGFAALTAAAYAKLLLSTIPALPVVNVDAKLREYYINRKNNRLRIERLSGDPLDMQQCYINLSIIEYKQNDQNMPPQEKSLSSTFSLPNRLKLRADNPEKEVTLPQLFHERKMLDGRKSQPRRILIRGRAGVGKTTLCKKIVHDFLHQQMWADLFDRIIWIPLRRLKGMSDLDEFFRQEFFKHEAERDGLVTKLRKTALDQTHKKTLWLLDGLDEVSGYRNPSGADLTEIFNSLLNEDNVIITSRPHAVKLSGLTPFDLELETVGFHLNQVQAYLAKAVTDPDTVNQISSFIQSHWLIQGLVRIPIQLDALCYSWDNDFRSGALLQTMTASPDNLKAVICQLENDGDSRVRCAAIKALGRQFPWSADILEAVIRRLENDDTLDVKHAAIEALGTQSPWSPEILKAVIRQLENDEDSDIRRTAIEALGRQSSWSTDILEAVIRRLENDDASDVRCTAIEALGRQSLWSPEILKAVIRQLENDEDSDIRRTAIEALGRQSSWSTDILEAVIRRLENDDEWYVRYTAIKALSRQSPWSPDILKAVIRRLENDEDSDMRHAAIEALGRQSPWSTDILETVIRRLENDDASDVRCTAIEALGRQSPWSTNILEAVIRRLENDDASDVRYIAIQTLSRQSPWSPNILEAVKCRLENDEEWYVRYTAIQALGTQYPWSLNILEAVMRRLEDDDDSHVRCAAIEVVGRQSSWSPDILEAVIRRLENDDASRVRRAAIEALGTQSPWSPDILEAVVRQLENDKNSVVASDIEALLWKHDDVVQNVGSKKYP
ncbi:hypothetical protein ZTR_09753 [Talaromyces verruculosus]|nr:hypothetical protein ZTR_09753 [Talaromyces verruculosus]